MSNLKPEEPSKIQGYGNKVMGTMKEGAGKLFGNPQLQGAGQAQTTKGQAEIEAARAQGMATAKEEQYGGAARETKGAVLGDTTEEMKGTAERLKGETRETAHHA